MKKINAAVWTTKYKNDLPDSAFMYIEPGGKKDDEGKTTPRSLRHFPYKDMSGKVDVIHLRNAIARIPQAKIPLKPLYIGSTSWQNDFNVEGHLISTTVLPSPNFSQSGDPDQYSIVSCTIVSCEQIL